MNPIGMTGLIGKKGQSLIQVLVAAAMLSVLMLSFMSFQQWQQKTILSSQAVMSRNFLQLRVERYLLDPTLLNKTFSDPGLGNVALNNCINGFGSPPVISCAAATGKGFSLVDPWGVRIAGTSIVDPVRYDYSGAPCAVASAQCLFAVYTTYSATCPAASPCSNPIVTAQYNIDQAPGITPVGGMPLKNVAGQPLPLRGAAGQGSVVACLGGCGGLYPNVVGAIAQYNWADKDGVYYKSLGINCTGTFTWTGWAPGGATANGIGGPAAANGALYFCSK
jgi:hypothetical protein